MAFLVKARRILYLTRYAFQRPAYSSDDLGGQTLDRKKAHRFPTETKADADCFGWYECNVENVDVPSSVKPGEEEKWLNKYARQVAARYVMVRDSRRLNRDKK